MRRTLALGTAPPQPLVAQARAGRRAHGGAGVCALFQAVRPARVDARSGVKATQRHGALTRAPPCAAPTTPPTAGAGAALRRIRRTAPAARAGSSRSRGSAGSRECRARPARSRWRSAGRASAANGYDDRTDGSCGGGGSAWFGVRIGHRAVGFPSGSIYRPPQPRRQTRICVPACGNASHSPAPKKQRMLLCKAERGLL